MQTPFQPIAAFGTGCPKFTSKRVWVPCTAESLWTFLPVRLPTQSSSTFTLTARNDMILTQTSRSHRKLFHQLSGWICGHADHDADVDRKNKNSSVSGVFQFIWANRQETKLAANYKEGHPADETRRIFLVLSRVRAIFIYEHVWSHPDVFLWSHVVVVWVWLRLN